MMVPVVLCGGAGSRLWPLSRPGLPKPFLSLVSEHSLLQDTVLRLAGLADALPIVLVGNDEHRFIAAEQLRDIGATPRLHILEPVGRNTAPAIAAAALAVSRTDPDAVLLVLPADHLITDTGGFHALGRKAVALAQTGLLVTMGIRPDSPATGYGYIRRGEALAGHDSTFRVAQFVEKPDAARAAEYLAGGNHLWNSGMFAFRADRYLEELGRFRPDIAAAVAKATAGAREDLDFLRLDATAFKACPSDSVDYAVMEKTDRACVLTADIGWRDLGTWSALWELASKDAAGNSTRGDVLLKETGDCYVRSESRRVVAIGAEHLCIIETPDAVLVAGKASSAGIPEAGESTAAQPYGRVYRPWGHYESLDGGERFQAKRLVLKPGAKISLQRHARRAEHWVVVSGTARVTKGNVTLDLHEDQSTYIPQGILHRLENTGATPLHVIEVQSGDYLGEDDIERMDDDYHRG